nr:hypothetical protein [Allomuricauda sp.]
MRNSILTWVVGLVISTAGLGQGSNTSAGSVANKIPQERVFVQLNESLLFSGEHLLYKVYGMDTQQRKLTSISKMAYVSLVDKNGTAVFTHKIRLEDGVGYGDFFVPTSIETGSYKLLGYSEWMKNLGVDAYFNMDVHVINPYQPIPEAYLERKLDSAAIGVTQRTRPTVSEQNSLETTNDLVQVKLNKDILGLREQLTLDLSTNDSDVQNGNYALSVRRVEDMAAPATPTAVSFVGKYLTGDLQAGNTVGSLPELRGEMVSGTILDKDTKQPVEQVRVSLSLPGKDYLFKVVVSNKEGRFSFLFDQEYENVTGAIQILADNWDAYEIVMDEPQQNYGSVEVSEFKVSKEMEDYILQKSIQNQIENGYKSIKSDSIIPAQHELPYYRKFTVAYDLDDYTRFNSIQETIVEVVDQLSVRRLDNGERAFEIRPEQGFTDLALLPMVFVDGLFIKRHEDFMDYSAKKIKSIHFSRNKVILGPQVFQGVLSFKTIDGNFYNDFFTPHIVNLDLFKPQPKKMHFAQQYNSGTAQDRIPDFRHQLLWIPNLDLSSGSKTLDLYTSDVAGEYELILEGFSSIGKPVSVKRRFTVQ